MPYDQSEAQPSLAAETTVSAMLSPPVSETPATLLPGLAASQLGRHTLPAAAEAFQR